MKHIINTFKNLDELTYKIMKEGLKGCLVIAIIATVLLIIYNITESSLTLYYIGIAMFKLSSIFGVEFIICGIIVDNIKKQII